MKRLLVIFVTFVCSFGLFGQEVSVKVDPETPIKNETFNLIFSIQTESEDRPYISFDPGHARVLGRERQGISINTRIVNGQFTTIRTVTYAYQVVADRAGQVNIRDINVDIGGNTVQVESIRFNVLETSPRPREIFAKVVADTEEAFIGQGIDVRYYLYYRTSIVGREIEQFPRLDNFTKRFHMPGRDSVETVQYQGNVYRRMYVYGARVFPQREGFVTVDPIRIRVQYTRERGGSSPFGMRTREYATRTVMSEPIRINVRDLPGEGVPSSFRGLVGEHSFNISSIRDKHLVNEPIEIRLSVEGGGALEEFSAPLLYDDDALEEFDRQSTLQETSFSEARKDFNYIFLGRAPGEIRSRDFYYSYFDYKNEEYIERSIRLPGFVIDGPSGSPAPSGSDSVDPRKQPVERVTLPTSLRLISPNFEIATYRTGINTMQFLSWLLFSICVGLIIFLLKDLWAVRLGKVRVYKLTQEIIQNGVTYSSLYELVKELDEDGQNYVSLKEYIKESKLDDELKNYFINLINKTEGAGYSDLAKSKKVKVKKEKLHALIKGLR